MRSSKSRSRNKSNRQRSLGNIVNRVFDSSGPEGKVRGTPQQIIDKYLMLARDAQLSNDRVAEQSFFQHAEHYTRLLGEAQREMAERQQQFQQQQHNRPNGEDDRENGGRDHMSRDHGREGAASVQADANQAGNETSTSQSEPAVTSDAERSQVEIPQTASKSGGSPRRSSRSRSSSAETGAGRAKPVSQPADSPAPEQSEPSALGLPDVVGSSEEGGLVETPESGSGRKSRAKPSTARSRSSRTTTSRKKSTKASDDSAEASAVPAPEKNGTDNSEG
ncbi:DUF4167 domain-containing protein [Paracoccus onubensis]|uniref:DUF4167 domain-containing protein n=1 Tax=Paracoccus onubensis TaxID=1675788 RepID=UPI002730BD52|nr:DUF4167 domain-containing protein [Paracoccus onubensis]MDP0927554.1 DUF4167 domain-containing protein [Paracoccus onubensis]